MSSPGFAFANPQPSPDNYDEFDPQDVFADSAMSGIQTTEAIPPPWKTPPVMSLSDVIGPSAVQEIQSAGKIVFHSAGDTGGIKEPSHQFAVADAMAADIGTEKYADGRPAFLYHLGDVIYYFGQERYYYDQFYDPYRDYAGPSSRYPEIMTAYFLRASQSPSRWQVSTKISARNPRPTILRQRALRAPR